MKNQVVPSPQLGIFAPPGFAGQMHSAPRSCKFGVEAVPAVTIVALALRRRLIIVYVCTLHELPEEDCRIGARRECKGKADALE